MTDVMTQEDAMNMDERQAIQILEPMAKMMIDQNGCPISSAYFALQRAIEALSERKKGEWIYDPEPYPMGGAYGHYECNQCGEWIRGSMTNYCPHCGAKMEVKK